MSPCVITPRERTYIRLISESLRLKTSESETIKTLIDNGLAPEIANDFYHLVVHGIKAGVTAGVTDGLSAKKYNRGQLPIWDAAFDEGYKEFTNAVRSVWLYRLSWVFIPIAIIIIWFLLR
jgi:hypothetical protein